MMILARFRRVLARTRPRPLHHLAICDGDRPRARPTVTPVLIQVLPPIYSLTLGAGLPLPLRLVSLSSSSRLMSMASITKRPSEPVPTFTPLMALPLPLPVPLPDSHRPNQNGIGAGAGAGATTDAVPAMPQSLPSTSASGSESESGSKSGSGSVCPNCLILQARVDQLERQLEEDREQINQQYNQLREEFNRHQQQDNHQLRDMEQRRQVELRDMEQRHQVELRDMEQRRQASLKKHDQEIASLKEAIARLEKKIETLAKEQAEIKREQADLKKKFSAFEEQNSDLTNRFSDLKKEHSEIKKEHSEIKREHSDLTSKFSEIKKEHSEINSILKTLLEHKAKAEEDKAKADEEKAKADGAIVVGELAFYVSRRLMEFIFDDRLKIGDANSTRLAQEFQTCVGRSVICFVRQPRHFKKVFNMGVICEIKDRHRHRHRHRHGLQQHQQQHQQHQQRPKLGLGELSGISLEDNEDIAVPLELTHSECDQITKIVAAIDSGDWSNIFPPPAANGSLLSTQPIAAGTGTEEPVTVTPSHWLDNCNEQAQTQHDKLLAFFDTWHALKELRQRKWYVHADSVEGIAKMDLQALIGHVHRTFNHQRDGWLKNNAQRIVEAVCASEPLPFAEFESQRA